MSTATPHADRLQELRIERLNTIYYALNELYGELWRGNNPNPSPECQDGLSHLHSALSQINLGHAALINDLSDRRKQIGS